MTKQAGCRTGWPGRPARRETRRRVLVLGAFATLLVAGRVVAQDPSYPNPVILPTYPNLAAPGVPDWQPVGQFAAVAQAAPAVPVLLPQPPAKPNGGAQAPLEQMPAPKILEGFDPGVVCLPRLPGLAGGLGRTPVPTAKELAEYNHFVKEFVDPHNTLDLIEGRARLMVLKETPKRMQIADESIASYNLVGGKEVTLIGKKVGTTVFNMWFVDPRDKTRERVLSYLVRVMPDPEAKERLDNVYKALEEEINRTFPDSVVHLKMVGDKLVITGQAHDILEATQILRIVHANAPKGKDEAEKIPVGAQPTLRPGDPGMLYGTPGIEDFKVTGSPRVINLLRVPGEQQVMLKVTVAEVNRSAARSIGLNFNVFNKAGLPVFQQLTGNVAGGTAGAATGGFSTGFTANNVTNLGTNISATAVNNLPAVLDNGQLILAINALRTLAYARSLAEPNLVALNGQMARFQAGGQFPVPIVTGFTATGLQGVSFVPFGVQLIFTPYITDKDRIRLNVAATVSTRDTSSGTTVNGAFVSGLNTRNFLSTVELRQGQTLAVAGLIQNNLGMNSTRVPFFGDLPFLGRLAGVDQTSAGEQELVILITPVLVHPMEPKQVPPLPGSDLFEPGDLEFYLLGRLESRRPYDYRSAAMTDLDRMRRYHRCERLYICGPSGYQPHP